MPLPLMDECRKRVLGIIAGILVARHLRTTEDLFDNRPSPRPSPWLRRRFSGRSASCGRWTTSLPASDHTTGPFSRMHISATVSLLAQGESPGSCHSEESLTRGFAPPLSHGTRVGSGAEGYDSFHIENGTVLVLNIAPHISPTGVGVICSTEQGTISTQEFFLS